MSKKLKTKQMVAKRIKVTGSKKHKKLMRQSTGKAHFNTRLTGKRRRNKRRDRKIGELSYKTVRQMLPYA